MDDLISRQAALEALNRIEISRNASWYEFYQKALTAVGILPSAQPVAKDINVSVKQPGWIPCSERLPEDEEEVVVSVRDDSGDNTLDYSSCGWYACAGDFWVVDNEANPNVIAWMPLPAPWKGEKHGTPRAVLSQKPVR